MAFRPNLSQLVAVLENDEYLAWCLACGNEFNGYEPDVRNANCESCGEHAVFAAYECLNDGLFIDDVENE